MQEFKQLELECSSKVDAELHAKELKLRKDLDAKLAARNRLRELNRAPRVSSSASATNDFEDEKEKAEMENRILSMRKNHEVSKLHSILYSDSPPKMKVQKLQDDILHNKILASKNLKLRVDNRKVARAAQGMSESSEGKRASSISFEDFMLHVKQRQRDCVHRLKSFIAQWEYKENAVLSKSVIVETIIEGYKKQCLYETRALKNLKLSQELSLEERTRSILEASDQIVKRFDRDLKNVMESLHSERLRDIKSLNDRGVNHGKLLEAEQRRDIFDLDQLRKEFSRVMFTIIGLNVDSSTLYLPNVLPDGVKRRESAKDYDDEGLEESEEDSLDSLTSFAPPLFAWMTQVLKLHDIFARTVPCLYSIFYTTHVKVYDYFLA